MNKNANQFWYSNIDNGSNSLSSYDDQQSRQGRTLINQFPFNQGAHLQAAAHHGDHHGSHHGDHHGAHGDHGHHGSHGSHTQHGFQNGFPQLHQGIMPIMTLYQFIASRYIHKPLINLIS